MEMISLWGPIMNIDSRDICCYTLSSALASLVSAPKAFEVLYL